MSQVQPEAGPSRPRKITKLRPPLPTPPPPSKAPTLPTKILQGAGTKRNNPRPNFPRNTLFVTRRTGLGLLLARARGLILDEGYTHITIYALGAAISHAMLMLHALLDILPYPVGPNGMWYEIKTGSVRCVDEVENIDGEDEDDEFPGLGRLEEGVPEMRERWSSSVTIDVHVEPKKGAVVVEEVRGGKAQVKQEGKKRKDGKKARPCAKKRRAKYEAENGIKGGHREHDEEAAMNA